MNQVKHYSRVFWASIENPLYQMGKYDSIYSSFSILQVQTSFLTSSNKFVEPIISLYIYIYLDISSLFCCVCYSIFQKLIYQFHDEFETMQCYPSLWLVDQYYHQFIHEYIDLTHMPAARLTYASLTIILCPIFEFWNWTYNIYGCQGYNHRSSDTTLIDPN